MKRLLLSLLLASLITPAGLAATDTYINNGIVSAFFPPTPAPDIDTLNFVNNGLFQVTNIANAALSSPMVPYSTSDTLNYSNRNRMIGDPGFRFELFDVETGRYRRSANFVNANIVNETNATIYGASYVQVSATNVVNRGTLAIGGPGLMTLTGDNLDLT